MTQMYKRRVLSYIEGGCVSFFHAAPSRLEPLDRILSRFLRFLGICDEIGFLEYNLAPLNVRRQISALGLIRRCALNKAPGALVKFFSRQDFRPCLYRTRFEASKHNNQIYDIAEGGKGLVFSIVYCLDPFLCTTVCHNS